MGNVYRTTVFCSLLFSVALVFSGILMCPYSGYNTYPCDLSFTTQSPTSSTGIYIQSSADCRVSDNTFQYGISPGNNYTMHEMIRIERDSDFGTEGWPGNGTINGPYVIENLLITGEHHAIYVANTSAHFMIRDCWIIESQICGIEFNHVSNGTIEGCHMSLADVNMLLSESSGCTVYNNSIMGGGLIQAIGLKLVASNRTYVTSNSFEMIDLALQLEHSNGLHFSGNRVFQCGNGLLVSFSEDCLFSRNLATECGFSPYQPSTTVAIGSHLSSVYSPTGFAFEFTSSSKLVVQNNTFQWTQNIIPMSRLLNCSRISLLGNNMTYNTGGLSIVASFSVELRGNTIHHSLRFDSSTNCSLIDNCLSDGVLFMKTVPSSLNELFYSVEGNKINDKKLVYSKSVVNHRIDCTDIAQLLLVSCSNVTAYSGNFSLDDLNLYVTNSLNTVITDSSFLNSGIELVECSLCRVENSTIGQSYVAVQALNSSECEFASNIIESSHVGFFVGNSTGCFFIRNDITNCQTGIWLVGESTSNVVYANTLVGNGVNGIDDGNNNSFDDGIDQGNTWDDYLGFGPYHIPGSAQSVDNYPSPYILGNVIRIGVIAAIVTIPAVLVLTYRRRR